MKTKLYFPVLIALSFFTSQSCKKQDASYLPGADGAAGLVDSPHVLVTAHVKQQLINVPNAKLKLVYNWNGVMQKDSVYTDTSGTASFMLPLNIKADLTITSHCGVLLYERKFGPFVDTSAVDTSFGVLAYSPICDSIPPDEYVTYNINGTVHRLIYPGDVRGFFRNSTNTAQYSLRKSDNSDAAGIDFELEGYHVYGPMFLGPNQLYSTFEVTYNYNETGTTGGYTSGTFVMDRSIYLDETLHPDTEYKIPGTFRFKIRPRTDDPWYWIFE